MLKDFKKVQKRWLKLNQASICEPMLDWKDQILTFQKLFSLQLYFSNHEIKYSEIADGWILYQGLFTIKVQEKSDNFVEKVRKKSKAIVL